MNPEGNKRSLKASQPGNYNAEKTGLHSKRRRAENARKVQKAIDKDPTEFCAQDRKAVLAEEIAMCELLAKDIAEYGVSDRKGDLRRSVGAYSRALQRRHDLTEELETELAASAAEAKHAEPWSPAEGLRLLRDIAHNCISAPAASIKAIEILDDRAAQASAQTPMTILLHEFVDEMQSMSDEELDREHDALSVRVTTGAQGPEYEPRRIIRRLAAQPDISKEERSDLYWVLQQRLRKDRRAPNERIRELADQGDIEDSDIKDLCLDLMVEFPFGC